MLKLKMLASPGITSGTSAIDRLIEVLCTDRSTLLREIGSGLVSYSDQFGLAVLPTVP